MPARQTLVAGVSKSDEANKPTDSTKKSSATVSSKEKMDAADSYASANDTNADEVKYKMAVEAARNNLKDQEGATDRELKTEIDNELKKLGASKSGADLRGETAFSQALDMGRGFIDDATLAGGNLLDLVFDNTVGNAATFFLGEDTGNEVRNFMNGEDLQGVVDVGTDIALSALGPAGWGLMLGKNAIQQSGNIMDALSDRDRVTLEEVDATERGANLLEGVGGIALSAVPVLGKAKNLAKAGDLAKTAAKSATQGPFLKEAGPKGFDAMIKPNVDDAMRTIRKPFRSPDVDDFIAIRTQSKPKLKLPKHAKNADNAPKHAKESASVPKHAKEPLSIKDKIASKMPNNKMTDLAKKTGRGMAATAAGGTTAAISNIVPSVANGDADLDQLSRDEMSLPIALAGVASMLGGKHRISPTGKKGGIGSLIPAAALAASGSSKQTDRIYEKNKKDGMSDEEIIASLKVR